MKSERQRLHLEKLAEMKRGKSSPLKGRIMGPMSKENRLKISEGRKRYFANGGVGPRLGKKHSEITKEKMSQKALQRDKSSYVKSNETKAKMSLSKQQWWMIHPEMRMTLSIKYQGDKGSNWQGGKTLETIKIRNSFAYKEWKRAILQRDNFICQICGTRGGRLAADHIKPFSLFPELRTELTNGRTLCWGCHQNTNTFGGRINSYAQT